MRQLTHGAIVEYMGSHSKRVTTEILKERRSTLRSQANGAKGLMIYASGFGFSTLVRALVTATVADDNVARLYSGLAIAETLGSLSGATFVTAAFTSSLSLGGIAAGTPFYVCAVSFKLLVTGFSRTKSWIMLHLYCHQ